jgi:hypothetical protein
MDLDVILQSLDEEIDGLQRARALLTGQTAQLKRSENPKRRNISAESRARMAAAQKARWAKAKT